MYIKMKDSIPAGNAALLHSAVFSIRVAALARLLIGAAYNTSNAFESGWSLYPCKSFQYCGYLEAGTLFS